MKKEVLFSLSSLYRDDFRVTSYRFGEGEKSVCVVGALRGDEVQQLYICGKLIKELKELEEKGCIAEGKEILVVPSMNSYGLNTRLRFWCPDNTDINRRFPGIEDGETTERIANAIFKEAEQFKYNVQFPSFYVPGAFVPHVKMMKTGCEPVDDAELFGLPYIVLRDPNEMDKSTLNYSLLGHGAEAFSIYTMTREYVDERTAGIGINAVLRFLRAKGVLTDAAPDGISAPTVLNESDMLKINSVEAGIYRRLKNVGDKVKKGELLAQVIHSYEGEVINEITAPADGMIFFAHQRPMISEYTLAFKLIPLPV